MTADWGPDQEMIELIEETPFEDCVKDLFKYALRGATEEQLSRFLLDLKDMTAAGIEAEVDLKPEKDAETMAMTWVLQVFSELWHKKITFQPYEVRDQVKMRLSILDEYEEGEERD